MPDDDEPTAPPSTQYFAPRPRTRSAPQTLRFVYRGELLAFVVDRGIFASHGLDPGTALLIENLVVERADQVLDLGCGWGAVGIAAGKLAREGHVVLTEVNRRAARAAEQNVERNRLLNAEVRTGPFFEPVANDLFDVIATNPPYRVGRENVLRILHEAPARLRPQGRLLLVGKGSLGIRFYQEWLAAHWPGTVEVLARGSGYRVVEARRDNTTAPRELEEVSARPPLRSA
ncbi:MAG: class I SAM-dependent methyltransferase [Thermoplasmata archaeon]